MDYKFVDSAISELHKGKKRIAKNLERQEALGTVSITINLTELETLKHLVSGVIGQANQEWYDITHDDTYTSIYDMAYDLGQVEQRTEEALKLFHKLNS